MLPRLFAPLKAAVPPGPDALVWWLALIMSAGVTAVLPVLPLYAETRGADLAFLGLMVGAYMAFNLMALYPAGWLSDRVGRRTLMAVGLVGYGLASMGFLLLREPWFFVVLRAIEGVAGACFTPAALAYVADRAPEHERATRIAQLTVAQNLGLLLGPVFGGAMVMAMGLGSPFAIFAVLCVVGGGLIARLPPATGEHAPQGPAPEAPPGGWWQFVQWWVVAGLCARTFTAGIATGLYETAWPLYMTKLGASPWDVGMSWTFFALPAVLLAPLSGRLINRVGPARPAIIGAFFSAIVTVSYALVPRVDWLLLLSMIEGIGFAFAFPAASTLNVQAGPAAVRGRVIGLITAVGTLGALTGALLMPPFYARDPVMCFYLTGACVFVGAVVLGVCLAVADRKDRSRGPHAASSGQSG